MTNTKAEMKISKERWEGFPEKDKSWMLFDTLQDIGQRVKKLEDRKLWDSAKSFAGGVIGGALAVLGIKWGGG